MNPHLRLAASAFASARVSRSLICELDAPPVWRRRPEAKKRQPNVPTTAATFNTTVQQMTSNSFAFFFSGLPPAGVSINLSAIRGNRHPWSYNTINLFDTISHTTTNIIHQSHHMSVVSSPPSRTKSSPSWPPAPLPSHLRHHQSCSLSHRRSALLTINTSFKALPTPFYASSPPA